jgi:hypothetical protein
VHHQRLNALVLENLSKLEGASAIFFNQQDIHVSDINPLLGSGQIYWG